METLWTLFGRHRRRWLGCGRTLAFTVSLWALRVKNWNVDISCCCQSFQIIEGTNIEAAVLETTHLMFEIYFFCAEYWRGWLIQKPPITEWHVGGPIRAEPICDATWWTTRWNGYSWWNHHHRAPLGPPSYGPRQIAVVEGGKEVESWGLEHHTSCDVTLLEVCADCSGGNRRFMYAAIKSWWGWQLEWLIQCLYCEGLCCILWPFIELCVLFWLTLYMISKCFFVNVNTLCPEDFCPPKRVCLRQSSFQITSQLYTVVVPGGWVGGGFTFLLGWGWYLPWELIVIVSCSK